MSVTNAVSSIIAIGALVQLAPDLTKISTDLSRPHEWIRWLSVLAIALATVNMLRRYCGNKCPKKCLDRPLGHSDKISPPPLGGLIHFDGL